MHGGWNAMALAVDVAALVSWRRVPSAAFGRAGVGRWWALLGTLGLTAVLGGFWVPVGALVWFAHWRPRVRVEAASPAASDPPPPTVTRVPGEPLL
jgi:hypothetical protein